MRCLALALAMLGLLVVHAHLEDTTGAVYLDDQTFDVEELGETMEAGCGIKSCAKDHWLQSPDDVSCSCQECALCDAGKWNNGKGCDHSNGTALTDTSCSICTTCEGGYFQRTACSEKKDTICSTCTKCCPKAGEDGAGDWCKKETTGCSQESDTVCEAPSDWKATVTTGMGSNGCGEQCGVDTGNGYMSNSTWNFIIKDKNSQLIFQGQPNVASPCSTDGCSAPVDFTNQPGVSNGKGLKKVTIMPANGGDDSWCMASLCISSASAGVKYEFAPTPSFWMNPAKTGACGGDKIEWTVELDGPLVGTC